MVPAADATTWEDVTMTTPIKLQNDHASFNTSVAARFVLSKHYDYDYDYDYDDGDDDGDSGGDDDDSDYSD